MLSKVVIQFYIPSASYAHISTKKTCIMLLWTSKSTQRSSNLRPLSQGVNCSNNILLVENCRSQLWVTNRKSLKTKSMKSEEADLTRTILKKWDLKNLFYYKKLQAHIKILNTIMNPYVSITQLHQWSIHGRFILFQISSVLSFILSKFLTLYILFANCLIYIFKGSYLNTKSWYLYHLKLLINPQYHSIFEIWELNEDERE